MATGKLRVVFDTSVYISAFAFPDSVSFQAYRLAVIGKVILFCSSAIVGEMVGKLSGPKFGLSTADVTEVVRRVNRTAVFVEPSMQVDILADEPDNRILECGLESKAHLIVTGDRHLLQLKVYEGVGLARPADLLHMFP